MSGELPETSSFTPAESSAPVGSTVELTLTLGQDVQDAGFPVAFQQVFLSDNPNVDGQLSTFSLITDENGVAHVELSDFLPGDISAFAQVDGFLFSTDVNFIACFSRGTLVSTAKGEIAVEDLSIGDEVTTASGALRSIKWIGKRSYDGNFIVGRKDILPICFKAGCLADNVPRRDLWISPHHAMYLEGVLIEAKDLVNGVSIVQAEAVDKIKYFHIELDSHDVIIAEGALSETFIDFDCRGMFQNAREYRALYPNPEPVAARYCAKRYSDGYEVDAARLRIDARAGLRPVVAAAPPTLHGYVDMMNAERIAGWAQNPTHPEVPVCLDIFVGGRLIGQTLANRYREDLERAGLGSGRHSFNFTAPVGQVFAPGTVEVRRSIDGALLALAAMHCAREVA
jgi:hypothetical protein